MPQSTPTFVDGKTAADVSAQSLLQTLRSSLDGLTRDDAAQRLAQNGPNSLPERHVSLLARLARYFWGPIPWMIEVAALLSALVRHWPDFIIIVLLLLFNAAIGFWQEHKASSALSALKQQLALKCRVKRDGQWIELDAAQLGCGDIVRVRLG
ncbi:MAG: cation-transporting P-type ATPase, partial [Thiomonas sp.]